MLGHNPKQKIQEKETPQKTEVKKHGKEKLNGL